jgi:hypothetical protein
VRVSSGLEVDPYRSTPEVFEMPRRDYDACKAGHLELRSVGLVREPRDESNPAPFECHRVTPL